MEEQPDTERLKRVIMLMKTERNKDTARIMIGRILNDQKYPVL